MSNEKNRDNNKEINQATNQAITPASEIIITPTTLEEKSKQVQEITDWLVQLNNSGPIFDNYTVMKFGAEDTLKENLEAHARSLLRTLKVHLPIKFLPDEENRVITFITFVLSYTLVDNEWKDLPNFKGTDGMRKSVVKGLYAHLVKGLERDELEYARLLSDEIERLKTGSLFDEQVSERCAQVCAKRVAESEGP